MKRHKKLLLIIVVVIQIIFTLIALPTHAQAPANFANCRLGLAGSSNATGYDLEQLNLGRYLHYSSKSTRPAGIPDETEYIHIIRVKQNKVDGWDSAYVDPPSYSFLPDEATIINNAITLPGSLWFIGNEIDKPDLNGFKQDEITPELYATAYHELRAIIKAADPTARVGPASVIQGTPLRIKYLDRIWNSYAEQYGHSMGQDTEAWNIHGFILREVKDNWGAGIPPGLELGVDYAHANEGFLYGASSATIVAAHHDVDYFIEFTENMRTWMVEKGERHKPLINTEMGVLYTTLNGYTITSVQANAYMTEAFTYLFNATDPDIGLPGDENRLVQGWIWFSLNSSSWNGALFDPSTKNLTAFGTNWKNYVEDEGNHPLAALPKHNLVASNLRTEPAQYVSPTELVSFTLKVDISNSGNVPTNTSDNVVVTFWDRDPAEPNAKLIAAKILDDLPGCGEYQTLEVVWPNRVEAVNTWYVKIDPIAAETNTSDNLANDTGHIINPAPSADLSLTKTVDNSEPTSGQQIEYVIQVANSSGLAATNVTVNDPLPSGLTFNGYTASQGVYSSAGPWNVGTLDSQLTATLTISATINDDQADKTITNTATINSSDLLDNEPNNNTAQATISVGAGEETEPDSELTYLPMILK